MTDLSIPDFLKVGKNGKNLHPGSLKKVAKRKQASSPAPSQRSAAQEALDGLDHFTKTMIEAEMKANRFMLHWLLDPGTVRVFTAEMNAKRERREEAFKKLKEMAAEKKANEPPKIAKPHFGEFIFISSVQWPNPRAEGTKGREKYAEMREWAKKNPRGSVMELFKVTSYKRIDFDFDVLKGRVKTDVIKKRDEKCPLPPPIIAKGKRTSSKS